MATGSGDTSPPRLATMSDVAAKAGVSVMTVSNVVNKPHLVADRTQARVRSAMRRLNFRPNLTARSVRLATPRQIGYALSAVQSPAGDLYMGAFLQDLARSCQVHDLSLAVIAEADGGGVLDAFEDLYYGRSIAGLVIANIDAEDARPWELQERGIAFVAYGVTADRERVPWSWVTGDSNRGIQLAVDHLVAMGHSELAYLGQAPTTVGSVTRLDGYRQACQRHGLKHSLTPSRVAPSLTDIGAGASEARRLLTSSEPPTGFVCASDSLAVGCLITARELSLKPGSDVGVTGFDDTPLTAFGTVGISSVRQHSPAIAKELVEILLARPETPRHVLIEPELIVRTSSDPTQDG